MARSKIRNMDEFARICGVSRPTLSKYFNDPGSVRASTRVKIEKSLKQHDYHPNVFAVNQNRRTTKNVGVIVPNLADPFFSEIGREMELACIKAGYSPIMMSSHGNPSMERDNLQTLRLLKPAGVLLAPFGRMSDVDYIREFEQEFPVVLFDANIEDAGRAYIGTDHYKNVDLMVDYLCRSGAPPCFFEMKSPTNPNANKRRNAYLDSMERRGKTPYVHQAEGEGWDFEAIGSAEGGQMLAASVFQTDTILCSNDRLAIGMLSAAYNLGIRVGHGDDCVLRIAGHDDHPFARFTGPRLTTIAQDYHAIADRAVETLLGILDAGDSAVSRKETHFPGYLVMRESA
jgi:DNA-binding LacI/PurR family transcriptional regulator